MLKYLSAVRKPSSSYDSVCQTVTNGRVQVCIRLLTNLVVRAPCTKFLNEIPTLRGGDILIIIAVSM